MSAKHDLIRVTRSLLKKRQDGEVMPLVDIGGRGRTVEIDRIDLVPDSNLCWLINTKTKSKWIVPIEEISAVGWEP